MSETTDPKVPSQPPVDREAEIATLRLENAALEAKLKNYKTEVKGLRERLADDPEPRIRYHTKVVCKTEGAIEAMVRLGLASGTHCKVCGAPCFWSRRVNEGKFLLLNPDLTRHMPHGPEDSKGHNAWKPISDKSALEKPALKRSAILKSHGKPASHLKEQYLIDKISKPYDAY